MNKKKVGPQDLTLLDEFEQDVEVVVEIMESGLKRIAKWQEDLGKTDLQFISQRTRNDVIKILESFHPFGDAFPQILRFLTIHLREFKGKVEDGYSNINDKIVEIVGKCSHHPLKPPSNPVIPYVEMCELNRYIDNLSEDLRFCVRTAREQQQPQKENVENGTLSIWAKMKVWLKHAVEKGWKIFTKSFWETVIDRVLPK